MASNRQQVAEWRQEIGEWRSYVKSLLYVREGPTCFGCGRVMHQSDIVHVHEGLLKRGDTPNLRWQAENKDMFYSLENCILLHGDCHELRGQSPRFRDEIVEYKAHWYGAERIRQWFELMRDLGLTKASELLNFYSEIWESEEPSE